MTAPRVSLALLAAVLVTAVGACASGDGRVTWRDLSVEVPDGWVVAERDDQKLSVANVEFGPGQDEELEVAVFLTHEPGATIDRWRELLDHRDAEVESDTTVEVDGLPASRLVFEHDANGTLLREMVVVVPSRDVVMLFQPVVSRGSDEGPATFEQHREAFERVLRTVRFEGDGAGETLPPELSWSGWPVRPAGTGPLGDG